MRQLNEYQTTRTTVLIRQLPLPKKHQADCSFPDQAREKPQEGIVKVLGTGVRWKMKLIPFEVKVGRQGSAFKIWSFWPKRLMGNIQTGKCQRHHLPLLNNMVTIDEKIGPRKSWLLVLLVRMVLIMAEYCLNLGRKYLVWFAEPLKSMTKTFRHLYENKGISNESMVTC